MTRSRPALPTVPFIDAYCAPYQDLFPDVRAFQAFKLLHLGLLLPLARKTLPHLAAALGLPNAQLLHHFLASSPWSAEAFRRRRLEITRGLLGSRPILLFLEAGGEAKKGDATNYAARQYLPNLGTIRQGVLHLTAYGLHHHTPFPLLSLPYKPRSRLLPGDNYRPQALLASRLLSELAEFPLQALLTDIPGHAPELSPLLDPVCLPSLTLLRSQPPPPLPSRFLPSRVRLWESSCLIDLSRGLEPCYYQFQPPAPHKDFFFFSNQPLHPLADLMERHCLPNWFLRPFKAYADTLGWADYRLTAFPAIEKWHEIVSSVFLLVSRQAGAFQPAAPVLHRRLEGSPVSLWIDWEARWHKGLTSLRQILQRYHYPAG